MESTILSDKINPNILQNVDPSTIEGMYRDAVEDTKSRIEKITKTTFRNILSAMLQEIEGVGDSEESLNDISLFVDQIAVLRDEGGIALSTEDLLGEGEENWMTSELALTISDHLMENPISQEPRFQTAQAFLQSLVEASQ